MKFDPGKYHRRSIRLKEYDNSQSGSYFVTICAKNRECLFGEIIDGVTELNKFGIIVQECWKDLPNHFPSAQTDAFIVMPNHVHAIIFLNIDNGRGTACRAPTFEQFGKPVPGSLPTIVRSFKSAVTRRINQIRDTVGTPVWQRNYYEHVIRNEKSLVEIRQYITYNPLRWEDDEENPNNILI